MARTNDGARSRYAQAFTSSIFEPVEDRSPHAFVPAGKRRDQTTAEMFGSYAEKDLKGMPKTFVPKTAELTARQKKLLSLSSEVLPCSSYPSSETRSVRGEDARPVRAAPMAEEEEEEVVDAVQRRQAELSSKLFGRETPGVEQASAERLMPNDFQWHNHPTRKKVDDGQAVCHSDRAYQEKCSMLFDHQSPQMQSHRQGQQLAREDEEEAEAKRRTNLYYSDLFDRPTPMELPADAPFRRARHHASEEDRIVIHQDWTDSKTELMGGHSNRPEHPALRKSDELHQARIFGGSSTTFQPPERLSPVTHDNSQKLTKALGQSGQSIHQAHLRTSTTPDEFYQEAEAIKHWEVAELHISGLPSGTDDASLRNFCQGFDLQIVKVTTEMDPVLNCCKGRAKVMVRYNPKRGSVNGLVRKLQDSNFRVEV